MFRKKKTIIGIFCQILEVSILLLAKRIKGDATFSAHHFKAVDILSIRYFLENADESEFN